MQKTEDFQFHEVKEYQELPEERLVEIACNNKIGKKGQFQLNNVAKLKTIKTRQHIMGNLLKIMEEYPSLLEKIDAEVAEREITHIEIKFYIGEKPMWEFNRSTIAVLYINQ